MNSLDSGRPSPPQAEIPKYDHDGVVGRLGSLPQWATADGRYRIVKEILFNSPKRDVLLAGFNVDGMPKWVASRLVLRLASFQDEPGKWAIQRLLDYLEQQKAGAEGDPKTLEEALVVIQELRARIRELENRGNK